MHDKMRNIKRVWDDHFSLSHSYKLEFMRQTRAFIIVSAGFTIAFAWRETLYSIFKEFLVNMFNIQTDLQSDIATSLAISFVGIMVIAFTSFLLKDKPYV